MLYDPKWETKVKSDPFTMENLVAWLETKPAREFYNFYCSGKCMIGQWVRSIDREASEPPFTGSFEYLVHGHLVNLERDGFDDVAIGEPTTFGGALDRARKALASPQ